MIGYALRNPFTTVIVVVAALYIPLLISGYRILISESEFTEYERTYDACGGDDELYEACLLIELSTEREEPEVSRFMFSCRYFTGRNFVTNTFPQRTLPNMSEDPDGKDECPFLYKP